MQGAGNGSKSSNALAFLLCFQALVLVSCGAPPDEASNVPTPRQCLDSTECVTPTIYYTPTLDLGSMSCASEDWVPVYDEDQNVLVELCSSDYERVRLNGAAKVVDGLRQYTIQYSHYDPVEQQDIFFYQDGWQACAYACGSSGLCLEPYFSVAADRNYYAFGTILYLGVLDGVVLPDGRRHDGYVRVEDTGGAIKGVGRFDFYTGDLDHTTFENPFVPLGLSDKLTDNIEYKVVSVPEVRQSADRECLK